MGIGYDLSEENLSGDKEGKDDPVEGQPLGDLSAGSGGLQGSHLTLPSVPLISNMFTESPQDSKCPCRAPGTQHVGLGATLILKESTGPGERQSLDMFKMK